ncbi:hypothetical protein SLS56_009646 [Neofusicoccum ribis]|uniref:Uncharacterized protein n=1 Tax=Neofusicoccum ribis TaxID=45134 RepID=A0ABR3SGN5_9PEZI
MGNAPSSEPPAPRESHRLTKPRTYNHTPSPKIGSQPGSPPSSKLSTLDGDDVLWTSGGSFRSKQEARQQIRLQLFGPQEDDALCHRETTAPPDDGDDSLGDLAASFTDRLTTLSRSGTPLSDPGGARTSTMKSSSAVAASKLPLVPDKRTIDIEAAIGILQELKKSATPEQLVALHKALLPTREEPAAVDTNNQAPPPKLGRRRSMAVPGLATRNPIDVLRKQDDRSNATSAFQAEEETHLWKMDELGPSPLAQIASLDVPQDGRPQTRAQTPGDMDYATLSNKIGQLMITNGAPSPAPSIISRHLDRRGSLPDLHLDESDAIEPDDYTGPQEAIHARPPPRRVQTFGPSHGYAELDAQSTEIPKFPRNPRNFSGLILQQQPELHFGDDGNSRRPARKLSKLSAEEYIAELQNSPYGESPFSRATPSPRPHESDVDESYYGHTDSDKARAEALRMLDGSAAASPAPYEEKIPVEQPSSAAPGTGFQKSFANGKLQRPAEVPHSDSGYSSGASLKAVRHSKLQARQEICGAAITSQKENVYSREAAEATAPARDSRQHGRLLDESADAADVQSLYTIKHFLALPPDEENAKEKTATEVKAEAKAETKETKETKSEWRRSLRRSKSWKRLSLKAALSPSPSPTPGTPDVDDSNELGSEPPKPMRYDSVMEHKSSEKGASQSARKKLQKRKSTAGNPTVQNVKPIDAESIPTVPSELSIGFSRRIEDSPGMDHLEHTCASQTSLEQPSGVSIRFPSPEPTEDVGAASSSSPLQHGHTQKRSSKSIRSPSPLKYALSFRRKPKDVPISHAEAYEEDSEVTTTLQGKPLSPETDVNAGVAIISDFGTVAQSLGGSPYDIALMSLPMKPQVSASSAVQPHHLSTSMIKASESGKNMNAATASEYARTRSKDHAIAASEQKQQQQQQYREEHPRESSQKRARPASYQDQSYSQQSKPQERQRVLSGSSTKKTPTPNFSRPQSMMAFSPAGYGSNNSSASDLAANKPLPPEPPKEAATQVYKPYRRGLLVKSFSHSQAPRRSATFDIREEKIPVEEEEVEESEVEFRKRALERRHTEKPRQVSGNRPSSVEEKIVVELEDELAMADARREQGGRRSDERQLPPSLRISTNGWEQTSKIWRERRDAFRTQSQGQTHGRSQSVQQNTHHRVQPQAQAPRPAQHVRSQSQVVKHHSQPSSTSSSARQSPSISPAWSPVPMEIPSPDKQVPNPFTARSTTTKKRSSIQRYYSTLNKNDQQQPGSKVEAVKEEKENEEGPAVPPKQATRASYSSKPAENCYLAHKYGVDMGDVPVLSPNWST